MFNYFCRIRLWWPSIFLWSISLITAHAAALDFQKEIPYGKVYPSPDAALTVQLLADQNPIPLGLDMSTPVNTLSIKNTRTGYVSAAYVESPPYLMGWTKDSKTIVTVEHIAGGNVVKFYNFRGTSWKPTEISPPTKFISHSKVLSLRIGLHSVTATFLVEYKPPEDQAISYLHKYTIVVDGETGITTKTVNHRKVH